MRGSELNEDERGEEGVRRGDEIKCHNETEGFAGKSDEWTRKLCCEGEVKTKMLVVGMTLC